MNSQSTNMDTGLVKRFYLTELFANLLGAPLAAAYGGFMIDFSRVPMRDFIINILLIMGINQLCIALPLNLFLGRRIRLNLRNWRSGTLDNQGAERLHSFLSKLPLVQALLIFGRMLLCSGSALLLVSAQFDIAAHIAAAFTFGVYSSFATGLIVYYFLHSATSRECEALVASLPPESPVFTHRKQRAMGALFINLPLMVPTLITSLGVFFLVAAIRTGAGETSFFTMRIVAALCMNILSITPILVYSQHFRQKRLRFIQSALEDMAGRGDTTSNIPTDLSDEYALTAHQINKTFDLFRQVLSQMDSTSGLLSGTVMNFSSQIRETVAATTAQASAVKEIVGTMENSNQTSRQIQDQAQTLSGNAQESHVFVDQGFGKVQDTIRKMDEIKNANLQTLNEIGDLTEEISSIGEIIEIINSIANQTRIIAFNAELEASSAGAAGTSFRIVAEEIRRLANSTVDSLVGIKGRINQIQQGSDRLLASSEEGTVKIDEGMRLSGDLNDIFMHIRVSAESTSSSAGEISQILLEQNEAFDQIFTTLKQISEGAEQVLSSTKMSGTEVGKLQSLIDELKQVLLRFDFSEAKNADLLQGKN